MPGPQLSCVLLVETELKGWQKVLTTIFRGITGLSFSMDAPDWWTYGEVNPMMFTKKLMYLRGEVDPVMFIKKLYKARNYAMLYRIDYGYEENPEESRKPNQNFMRFRFELDMLEESWCKKIIGAIKTIQGLSFTIDAPRQMGYVDAPTQMVYICGNIEYEVLMKMFTKTGIKMLDIDYGIEPKDPNLNPPPKKLEAPADGTDTQPAKDKEPSSPEIANTSTKHQAKDKKPRGFRRFCCPCRH